MKDLCKQCWKGVGEEDEGLHCENYKVVSHVRRENVRRSCIKSLGKIECCFFFLAKITTG